MVLQTSSKQLMLEQHQQHKMQLGMNLILHKVHLQKRSQMITPIENKSYISKMLVILMNALKVK